MPLEPMPSPQIDETRAGVLRIDAGVLGYLLRLPETMRVVGVRQMGFRDGVEVLIEGIPMPPCGPEAEADRVTLICHNKVDGTAKTATVLVNFDNAPDVQWKLRGPDPIPGT